MPNVVNTDADVSAILPPEYLDDASAPVRDGLVHAHAEQQKAYQTRSDYASSQSDIGRATGRYLDGLARDRGYQRQDNESDDDFRARMLAVPFAVTPDAIVAAVNAILATVGAGTCRYLEPTTDRFYVNNIGGPGPDPDHPQIAAGLLGVTPKNDTRLYAEDGGPPARSPGGAWVFNDDSPSFNTHAGRWFVLRVPHLGSSSTEFPTPWSAADTSPTHPRARGVGSLFLYSSGTTLPTGPGALDSQGFLYDRHPRGIDLYKAIADTVTQLVGHSIRWSMVSDPRLNA